MIAAAKSLSASGMYVSDALRGAAYPLDDRFARLLARERG
jgi:hypothetical protein